MKDGSDQAGNWRASAQKGFSKISISERNDHPYKSAQYLLSKMIPCIFFGCFWQQRNKNL